MTTLEIADEMAMRDLVAFTSLAHRLDRDGAMRLQVVSSVLVVSVAPLYPHGIGDSTPLVLAMRMAARWPARNSTASTRSSPSPASPIASPGRTAAPLPPPPTTMLVSWAGISPPRGPWENTDAVTAERPEVGRRGGDRRGGGGHPRGRGLPCGQALRASVWSRPIEVAGGTPPPSGLAFAADGLRFVPPGAEADVPVMESSGWSRLVTPGGHLLTREGGLRDSPTRAAVTCSPGDRDDAGPAQAPVLFVFTIAVAARWK